MRREIPIAICFLAGISFILEYFIPHQSILSVFETFRQWAIIVIAFAYVLGLANIVRVNYHVIQKKGRDWPYKVILVLSLFFMITIGIIFDILGIRSGGIAEGSIFNWVYYNAQYPLQATMFALLAFFIASAAFRAFRIRTFQASLLAVTAILVMIGRVPVGEKLWGSFPDLTEWIMNVPQLAGKRAIMIGAALGAISTALKVLTGLERTYLGGE
jgi:membrane-associated phospholipid phosphatase